MAADLKDYIKTLTDIETSIKKMEFDLEMTQAMKRFCETRIKYLQIAEEGLKNETTETPKLAQ